MSLDLARRYVMAPMSSLARTAAPALALAQRDAPVLAAGSDLRFALEEIAAAFAVATGMRVRLSMGSTAICAADPRGDTVRDLHGGRRSARADLHRDGFDCDEGDMYAVRRIVVNVRRGSTPEPDDPLENLQAALADGRITRLAIADPDRAPCGMRVREALQDAGLGMPVVLVARDMSEAQRLADLTVVIATGRILRAGTTAGVMAGAAALRAIGIRALAVMLTAPVAEHLRDGLTRLEAATGPLFLRGRGRPARRRGSLR